MERGESQMMHSPDFPVAITTPRSSDRPPSLPAIGETPHAHSWACIQCGVALHTNWNHCPSCGATLSRQKAAEEKVDAALESLGLQNSRLRTVIIIEVMGLTPASRT